MDEGSRAELERRLQRLEAENLRLRQADESLRRSESRLKEAQEIAHLGFWELDLVSDTLYWSDEIYRIFGIDAEQFGASYEAFLATVHPDDREFVDRSYTEHVEQRVPYDIVHRLLLRDGSVKYVHEHCRTEYDAGGAPSRSIGTVLDITERRRLEEQLRQAQKMEAIGRLSGAVAHDFNNLLTSILGYGELALMRTPPDAPLNAQLRAIYDAGEKAATLTRQLLGFSRAQPADMRIIAPGRILDRLRTLLVRVMGETVAVEVRGSDSCGNIRGDAMQIEQLLLNLALNARDAMPQGGTLSLEVREREVCDREAPVLGKAEPGHYVELVFRDTGVGMAADVCDKVFEPFFTTKPRGRGTGLGLSAVAGIVAQHKGHVILESQPGRGTSFIVRFPMVAEAAADTRVEEAGEMPRGTETILVVDDEAAIRQLVRHTMEPLGYRVLEASRGEEALQVIRGAEIDVDLLLTDVIMPGMNGRELADSVRAERRSLRVAFMSGYTDNLVADCGGEGMVLLSKPLIPSVLARSLRSLLDGA